MDDRAAKLKEAREQCAKLIENVDDASLAVIRAEVDQALAAARDAGFGDGQAGALVMWQLGLIQPTGAAAAAELLQPGWTHTVNLAIVLEVLDGQR